MMNRDQVIGMLQHCMAEPYCIDYKHHNCSKCNQRIAQDLAIYWLTNNIKWIINSIPIEYIEQEKRGCINNSISAVQDGDLSEAQKWSNCASALEALIANWKFISGPDWRDRNE